MLYPSINEIRKKADSRYTLVILAAKRARDIIDGKPILTDVDIFFLQIHAFSFVFWDVRCVKCKPVESFSCSFCHKKITHINFAA